MFQVHGKGSLIDATAFEKPVQLVFNNAYRPSTCSKSNVRETPRRTKEVNKSLRTSQTPGRFTNGKECHE